MSKRKIILEKFTKYHYKQRNLLMDIVESIKKDQIREAQKKLEELSTLTGPNFRYEEETLYPKLMGIYGEDYINKLLDEHDKTIEKAKELKSLLNRDSISEEEKELLYITLSPLLTHIAKCENLSVHIREMSGEDIQDIYQSMSNPKYEKMDLFEYTGQIRDSIIEEIYNK